MFHNVQCLLTALPELMAEIAALPDSVEISFETVTKVVNPSMTDSVTDDTYGDVDFQLLRCSNPACDVKQRAEASKAGWLQLRLMGD